MISELKIFYVNCFSYESEKYLNLYLTEKDISDFCLKNSFFLFEGKKYYVNDGVKIKLEIIKADYILRKTFSEIGTDEKEIA